MKNQHQIKRCARCILPETFPAITFNSEDLCNFCQDYPSADETKVNQLKLKAEMEEVITKHKGISEYDCVVAFSGGKDSSYILKMLVEEYELNCLAITIDNGFVSKQALENCKAVTAALCVDHIFYTPSPKFMNNMYVQSIKDKNVHTKAAIKRASAVCNSCINLINNYMLKTALQNKVALIAGGYISGQVPKDSAIIKLDLNIQEKLKNASLNRYITHFGPDSIKYFGLNTTLSSGDNKVYVLNPMLSISISEEEIKEKISVLGWKMTSDTGKNSSNCMLNDFGIAVHFKRHQFNPYVFEIAEQVRLGTMDRATALIKSETIPEFADLTWQAEKLGISIKEI